MRLTLKELFVFNAMQTDPNWSNFLYDQDTGSINLIDFGAAVEYPREFCVNYGRLVKASADQDRNEIIRVSRDMGFLTGEESQEFLEAHASAAMITGEPFRGGTYDFGTCAMTERNRWDLSTLNGTRRGTILAHVRHCAEKWMTGDWAGGANSPHVTVFGQPAHAQMWVL